MSILDRHSLSVADGARARLPARAAWDHVNLLDTTRAAAIRPTAAGGRPLVIRS